MLTWIIPNKLAKAAYDDIVPANAKSILVAAEYPEMDFRIVDEPIVSDEQLDQVMRAIMTVYQTMGKTPLVIRCQQGRSRSVAIACAAAALYDRTTYGEEHKKLRCCDETVLPQSAIEVAVRLLVPRIFSDAYNEELTTWRELLITDFMWNQESWSNIESMTLTREQLDNAFNCSWGGIHGSPFTVWTKKRVYFPACYDGSEWIESVSRHPDGNATEHIGG